MTAAFSSEYSTAVFDVFRDLTVRAYLLHIHNNREADEIKSWNHRGT